MPIIEADMPKFLFILIIFLVFSPVYGFDLPVSKISDDSQLRLNLLNTWLLEVPARVVSLPARTEILGSGERVEVSISEGREVFNIRFSRELMRGTSLSNRRATGSFPGTAQGSWILTRRKDNGEGTQIRIFLRSDQNTFIQFRPFSKDKSFFDVVLYGGYIAQSVPIALSFERLYTMHLNDILKLVENKFPVRYFEPDIASYREHRSLIANIREKTAPLRFTDDGAIDENGNYVFIKTLSAQNNSTAGLNCSGYTKWLIDGILRPVTGNRLNIEQLKAPFGKRGSSFTEFWEESRDVFFGLDWIRNLASEANKTLRSPAYGVLEEFEVREENFASIMINQNRNIVTNSYTSFMPEAGYGIEGLHPLLYTLAIDEPFNFYLAAVSNEIRGTQQQPRNPPLRQYYHIAALFPYFDENGNFNIAVFESAAETSFSDFRRRYPLHHVNLVKIPVTPTFDP